MSWGRGVSNNQAGELRMPSVPAFAQAKSKADEHNAQATKATLRVVAADADAIPETSSFAFVSPECAAATPLVQKMRGEGRAYVFTHGYPHFLTRLACHPSVPLGCIVISELQRVNLHCCTDEPYEWVVFDGHADERCLSELTLELRPRFRPDDPLRVPRATLVGELGRALFGLIVTENELFLVDVDVGVGDADGGGGGGGGGGKQQIVARAVSMAYAETEGEEEDELTLPDVYRGLVDAETHVVVQVDEVARETLVLVPGLEPKRPAQARPAGLVDVTTGDGEFFPVKRKLLRPCIALTGAVMAGTGVHEAATPHATVSADCCTFDRVLLFLEAQAKGLRFDVLPEHLEDMTRAAEDLRLQGLEDLCAAKRGAFASRVRREAIPFAEVVARNEAGEVLLTMDGMVLDVTRWLEEHPGGSTIIPEQALNVDSTVFFEIYHVSRQSFLYLKEFYIGELAPAERASVPKPNDGEASPAFLEQLRAHTTWRVDLDNKAKAFKSF